MDACAVGGCRLGDNQIGDISELGKALATNTTLQVLEYGSLVTTTFCPDFPFFCDSVWAAGVPV